uniref:Uncharacterized protein n=1 Tax=Arundo donax TaxID=35708 RepID=A0A0A9DDL0_ARUDO
MNLMNFMVAARFSPTIHHPQMPHELPVCFRNRYKELKL